MTSPDGTIPISQAMHIHAAFSERDASMESHLYQATKTGVRVIWWSDHDHYMNSARYRKVVHFTSLTDEKPAAGEGSAWHWQQQRTGSLTSASAGSIVPSPYSPVDPVPGSSLRLYAQATSAVAATLGFTPPDINYHGNLIGQSISIEALPVSIGATAYLEVRITTSHHPAQGGRPGGTYVLSYRIGGRGVPGTRSSTGLVGVVNVPVVRGQWNSLVLRPTDDIAALWPDMDSRDFAISALLLNAVSTGGVATGNFDYLRFTRSSGEVQLQAQREMQAAYASRYSSVAQRQALEVSNYYPHVNWFGGTVTLPNYYSVSAANYPAYLHSNVIPAIHAAGGLASYNHPYGAGGGGLLVSQAQQDQRLADLARSLIASRALGADIIEVGYPVRGGADLGHHVGLWDVLSRNGMFLTGNGVSDDHHGGNWLTQKTNWITSTWALSDAEPDLLTALAAGRAWCASLSRYRGNLDLRADGTCAMGSASISDLSVRQLTVVATDVPTGGAVEVVQGAVDYAGNTAPKPNTAVMATLTAADLAAGSITLPVDCSASSFVRSQVRDSAGAVVALSNPVWLLRETPPGGIPASRAC